MHQSLQPDIARIRHAELLNEARERQAVARLERHPRLPRDNPFTRLQTIVTAAGHVLPSAAASARAYRAGLRPS